MLYYATELSMSYLDSTIPYGSVLFHAMAHNILYQASPYNTIRHCAILNLTSQYLQKVYEGMSLHTPLCYTKPYFTIPPEGL